jgi:truncated hemoglobin YjbI
MFDDIMIGFHFKNVSRERIKAKEYEFAAEHLGGNVAYTGRPLREAHARHAILGGQFMRRLQILKETLARHAAPATVIGHFVTHTESLRAQITNDEGSDCGSKAAKGAG